MSKWTRVKYGCDQNPGCWDTGNGAIQTVCECSTYPGVERVTIESYCGRNSDNRRYYRLAADTSMEFKSLEKAVKAARHLASR